MNGQVSQQHDTLLLTLIKSSRGPVFREFYILSQSKFFQSRSSGQSFSLDVCLASLIIISERNKRISSPISRFKLVNVIKGINKRKCTARTTCMHPIGLGVL